MATIPPARHGHDDLSSCARYDSMTPTERLQGALMVMLVLLLAIVLRSL